jgi:hypothetical protein
LKTRPSAGAERERAEATAEIIEHIKQRSLEEQGKVVEFTRHLPNEETLGRWLNRWKVWSALNRSETSLPRFRNNASACPQH